MLLGMRGFYEQWKAFRQALNAYEPLPFTWVAVGSRIVNTGMWLRQQYGYDDRAGEIKKWQDAELEISRRLSEIRGGATIGEIASLEKGRAEAIEEIARLSPLPFLGLSGVVSYGGRRKRGFGIKRGFISEETLRSLDDTRTLRAPTPKRKRDKGHRKLKATVDGRMLLLTHKGRKIMWRTCMTEQTAQLTAERMNGK